MRAGYVVGYALLGLADALVPAALAGLTVHGLASYAGDGALTVAGGVVAAVLAVGVLVGAVAAYRGGKPFPLSRRAVALWKRYWWV
jgi:hypothetical protein